MSPPSPPTDSAGWPRLPLPLPPADTGLRPWTAADAPVLAETWRDADVARWLDPPDGGITAARTWIAGERNRRERGLALDLVIDHAGVVAGEVGFSRFDADRRACLIGYWTAAPHRGRGVASEAARTATDWMLGTVGASAVIAQCDPANTASHLVAEAAGFTLLSADHDAMRVYVRRSG